MSFMRFKKLQGHLQADLMVNEFRGSIDDTLYLQSLFDQTGMLGSLWLVIATTLVLSMQGGFLLLEAGAVRGKNTISVAQKNVTDLVVCGCLFLLLGASLAFGQGSTGFFGFGGIDYDDPHTILMLLYQFGFCATAATIVSGAVAERLRFKVYCIATALMALIIYPLFAHLVWGNTMIGDNPSFLADLGFIDYAGSTVVHIVGGGAALAAAIIVGARKGRFAADGTPQVIRGHSSVLSLLGTLILCIGWFGFNAGLATPGSAEFARVLLNTVIAMCMGGAGAMVVNAYASGGLLHPAASSRGLLGGLVAITAGCAYVDIWGAAILGLLGGLATSGASYLLLYRFKIDDPIDAVATHGAAGFVGTIGLTFFMRPEAATLSFLNQLSIQTFGAMLAFIWSFGVMYAGLKLVMVFTPVRVTEQEEEIGLNITEHDSMFDTDALYQIVGGGKTASNSTAGMVTAPNIGRLGLSMKHSAPPLVIEDAQGEESINVMDRLVRHSASASRALNNVENRLSGFEQVGNDWLMELDQDLNVSYVSERFRRAFGNKADQLIGRAYLHLLEPIDLSVEAHQDQLQLHKEFDDVVFAANGLDKIKRTFTICGAPMFADNGDFSGFRIRATDISSHVKAEEEIRFLAHHDSLTGLPNRVAFKEKLSRFVALAEAGRSHFAVFALDLDGFKPINDTYGHSAGDTILINVASRLKEVMGEGALLARLGGDEFVAAAVVREGFEAEDSEEIAKNLIAAIGAPVVIDGRHLMVGVSVGISLCPINGQTYREITRQADMALYEAKDAGRGTWFMYDPALDEQLRREKRLGEDMRHAIANDEFYLLYQPQLRLNNGDLTGFEALLRWKHPEFGELSPMEFIPIAEETGFIVELGDWVMEEACTAAASWPLVNGRRRSISVNMAPQQFYVSNVIEKIEATLAKTGLPAESLEVEITESTLMRDAHETGILLQAIRQMGVRVAVDDFGTGYSSLSYLKRFPIDRLKVDRTFVKDLQQDVYDQRITRAIVELGKSLEMNVIAEGVEMDEQWEILKNLGCDEMQGYLAAKPVPLATVLNMLMNADGGKPVYFPLENDKQAEILIA